TSKNCGCWQLPSSSAPSRTNIFFINEVHLLFY
ncbi:MAG: hypothetical protein ACI9BC_003245, partial [Crocinitomicaceae bacterium]